MANKLLLPYGLQDGRLVHITQVANGLACACICPGCNARLIARNNGKQKVAHFAHHKTFECTHGLQTALHLAAKDIILKQRIFRLPELVGQFDFNDTFFSSFSFEAFRYKEYLPNELYEKGKYNFPARAISIDNVLLEKKTGTIIPDIILQTAIGPLLVEIAVTHFIDEVKKEKIRQLGIPTIEIDLSKVARDLDPHQLEELLIHGVSEKKWIYNAKRKDELISQKAHYFEVARPYFEREHAKQLALYAQREEEQKRLAERKRYIEQQQELRKAQAIQLQQQQEQAARAEAEKQHRVLLTTYRKHLKEITIRTFYDAGIATAVKHVTSCPRASRYYEGHPYSSVEADCRSCQYFRGYWHSDRSIVCLAGDTKQSRATSSDKQLTIKYN